IVQDALLPVVSSAITLGIMFLVMWGLDPELTLLCLVVAPFMIVVLRHYAGPMADRSYEQHTAEGRIYDTIEQTLTAIPVVKAFGGEDDRRARLHGNTIDALRAALRSTDLQVRF